MNAAKPGIDANLGTLTEAISDRHWDKEAIRQQIAYRVQVLAARDFQPGNRVLIHFGNRLEFFAELLAIWQLGGCAIPVDARLTPFEVENLAKAADARFSIIDDETDPETVDCIDNSNIFNTLEAESNGAGCPEVNTAPYPRLDDDALILFTSGSTGTPKGVVHTHRSLNARWTTLRHSLGTDAYQRTLCLLPTHFGHGLICNCLFPLLSGCDLVIAPPFKADLVMRLGQLIDQHEISFMSSVPSVWNLALRSAKSPAGSSLRRIHIGSAPLSARLWTQVQEWAGINDVINAYGITETGSWVAGTTGGEVVPESGLIGEPWGAAIKIVQPDSTDGDPVECTPGEPGMVWLNTPALMKGYFQQQELTDDVIHGTWFQTGDIGFMDEQGRLVLKGRERDEINKGGLKVFPADIDEVVEQFEATVDVCSFAYEDAFYGENVGIALVLGDESEQSILRLHEWISQRLAAHKHPEQWYLLSEIPRTSRGKINRESVMEKCLEQSPLNIRAILRGETK